LERRRLAEYVQESAEKALVRRYSWLGLIVATVTGGLVVLVVQNTLLEARSELKLAEKMRSRAQSAMEDMAAAQERLSELKIRIDGLGSQAESMKTGFENYSNLSDRLSARISEESRRGITIVEALHRQIAALQAALSTVAGDRDPVAGQLRTVAENVRATGEEIARASKSIPESPSQPTGSGRIRDIPDGGSTEWDRATRSILLSRFDLDKSGTIDAEAEVTAIPCETWKELDDALRAGRRYSNLRSTYGFAPGYGWVGDAIGFQENVRKHADSRAGECGLAIF
jgi:hypothetical protein